MGLFVCLLVCLFVCFIILEGEVVNECLERAEDCKSGDLAPLKCSYFLLTCLL